MNDIDVEQIMSEIRSEIKAKGYKASDLKFTDIAIRNPKNFDRESLARTLSDTGTKWQVELYPAVSGGRFKRLVKKAIRKLVRSSFYDTIKKQESFNMNIAATLSEMEKWMRELEDRTAEIEAKLEQKK